MYILYKFSFGSIPRYEFTKETKSNERYLACDVLRKNLNRSQWCRQPIQLSVKIICKNIRQSFHSQRLIPHVLYSTFVPVNGLTLNHLPKAVIIMSALAQSVKSYQAYNTDTLVVYIFIVRNSIPELRSY